MERGWTAGAGVHGGRHLPPPVAARSRRLSGVQPSASAGHGRAALRVLPPVRWLGLEPCGMTKPTSVLPAVLVRPAQQYLPAACSSVWVRPNAGSCSPLAG